MVGDLMQIRIKRAALAHFHIHHPGRMEKESRKTLNKSQPRPDI